MANISTSSATPLVARATLAQKQSFAPSSPLVLGLPKMVSKGRVVRCSMEDKPEILKESESKIGLVAAAAMAAAVSSPAARALVDDRMSTEGTGLPFGLSNNLLGWILFAVFGLIWALYFTYTSSLDEDEDSGLSL